MNTRRIFAITTIVFVLSMNVGSSSVACQDVGAARAAEVEQIKRLLRPQYTDDERALADLVKKVKGGAVPLLAPELKSTVAWDRADAAWLLGLTDSAAAVAPLLSVMADMAETGARSRLTEAHPYPNEIRINEPSTTVAIRVARALVALKGRLSLQDLVVIERSYLALLQQSGEKSEDTREAVIAAFGQLGIRGAVPALCQIAAGHEPLGLRQRATVALGLLQDTRAIPILVGIIPATDEGSKATGDVGGTTVEDVTLQEYALVALGEFGRYQRARETVFKALAEHPSPRVRAQAATVIADKKFPGAVDALKLRLDDKGVVKGGVVVRSQVSLYLWGGEKEKHLPDRSVAEFAVDGLATIGSPEAATSLIEVTLKQEADKDSALFKAVVRSLGKFKDDRVADRLIGLAHPQDKIVPQEIVVSMGQTGNPKVIAFLTARALNAKLDPSERAQAITALGNPAYRGATATLVELLADHTFVKTKPSMFAGLTGPDWETRETICYHAAAALGAIRDATALAGLQKALGAGQLHKDEASAIQSAMSQIQGPEKK